MSGNRLVIDTNVIINQFNGNIEAELLVDGNTIFISAITVAELFSINLDKTENDYLQAYITSVNVVHTNDQIVHLAANLRKEYSIKLPDAIIAATAIYLMMPLATADKVFQRIKDIIIFDYEV